jgi:hypothetical protein
LDTIVVVRIVITVPWWERLGGAEAMLHMILQGAQTSGHELELVFLQDGPWPAELRAAGLRVEIVKAGRVRQLHRVAATVARLAALFRERDPDVILNWAAKTQLYGSPAAVLAGMGDRVVWWQHAIAGRHWLDLSANLLPARAIACYSTAAAAAQQRLWPHRSTIVIPAGARPVVGGAGAAAPRPRPRRSAAARARRSDRRHRRSAAGLEGSGSPAARAGAASPAGPADAPGDRGR